MLTDDVGQLQQIPIFGIQPDELLAGFLVRNELSSPKPITNTLRLTQVRNRDLCWLFWPYRWNTPLLANFADNAERTVLTNSLASIFRPTTAPHIFRSQLADYINLDPDPPLVFERLPPTPVQFCPTCLEEQIADVGFGYYRRIWGVPFAHVCRIHDLELVKTKCMPCRNLRSRESSVFRPWEPRCRRCGNFGWKKGPSTHSERSLSAQDWFEDLMMADLAHFSEDLQRACLEEAARRVRPKKRYSHYYEVLRPLAGKFISGYGLKPNRPVLKKEDSSPISPMLGFWAAMYMTFDSFSVFRAWLDENSTLLHATTPARVTYLDLS